MRTEKKLVVEIQAVLPHWLPPATAEKVELVGIWRVGKGR